MRWNRYCCLPEDTDGDCFYDKSLINPEDLQSTLVKQKYQMNESTALFWY